MPLKQGDLAILGKIGRESVSASRNEDSLFVGESWQVCYLQALYMTFIPAMCVYAAYMFHT